MRAVRARAIRRQAERFLAAVESRDKRYVPLEAEALLARGLYSVARKMRRMSRPSGFRFDEAREQARASRQIARKLIPGRRAAHKLRNEQRACAAQVPA